MFSSLLENVFLLENSLSFCKIEVVSPIYTSFKTDNTLLESRKVLKALTQLQRFSVAFLLKEKCAAFCIFMQ